MNKHNKLLIGVLLIFASAIIFLLLKLYAFQIIIPKSFNLLAVFITGLVTGGLTCLAVQGGLLASTIAMQEEDRLINKTKGNSAVPIFIFLLAKLLSYTLLGLLLGWFGSFFQLSLATQIIMQVIVIVFMFGTALNILEVHPLFRYFALQPPRFITRKIRSQAKSKSIFAPAILGAFTVFIPCGTTQAMMALAIGSGSPLLGAAILFAFILGTTPLFFILGYFATKLGDGLQKKFFKAAAVALILLALFNLRNTLGLAGVNLNFSPKENTESQTPAVTSATIEFLKNGYTPTNITVRSGTSVTLTLKNTSASGCIQSFVIPKLGIQKVVQIGTSTDISFTVPSEKGQIPFMCGMGMYRGVINVI